MSEEYVPRFTEDYVVPENDQIQIVLRRHDLDSLGLDRIVHGQVTDPEGNPISQAVIEPYGFSDGDRTTYGRLEGIDALAVTNVNGEFRIGMKKDGKLRARVSAGGYANAIARDLVTGRRNRIPLDRGTFVEGRVLKDGKPVPDIGLGLVQQSRSTSTFLGDKTISTNKVGRFQFVNVPANERLYVYGLMDSCRRHGAIPQIEVLTGANLSTVKLGNISFELGFSISGRILLSDDGVLPPNTRVLISREGPWDGQQVLVAPDGTFEITGVPAETCTLIARVQGYRPSARNRSLNALSPFGLLGLVDADIENLQLLLEPGNYLRFEFSQELAEKYRALKTTPLRGVEDN